MSKNKKAFVLYTDTIHTVELLTDAQAGKLIKIIFSYVNDQKPEVNDPVLKIAFEPIKQQLKRDLTNWKSETNKRVESGRKGGLATQSKRKQNEALLKDTKANQADSVSVSDSVTVSDNVSEKKNLKRVQRFTPPALSEVCDFFRINGLMDPHANDQANKFINHYQACGWVIGKNKPMKDWRAAVRSNWLKDINENPNGSEYTYQEMIRIHNDQKDQRTQENFEAITPGTQGTKWKLK